VTVSAWSSSSITITWTTATDDVSAPSALSYTAYRSLSNDLDTVAHAEANGTVACSGTALTQCIATSLNPDTPYYLTVVVKDEANNKAVYATASRTSGISATGRMLRIR
jgi:hypothetical protein